MFCLKCECNCDNWETVQDCIVCLKQHWENLTLKVASAITSVIVLETVN